jgi:hypothetical protein
MMLPLKTLNMRMALIFAPKTIGRASEIEFQTARQKGSALIPLL